MKSYDVWDLNSIGPGSVISVTGCGGKTTLIEYMAAVLSKKYRVGVATTVNIAFPPAGSFCRIYIGQCHEKITEPGIYYFADELRQSEEKMITKPLNFHTLKALDNCRLSRKLHGLSENLKCQALSNTDILLVEADGSAGRPVKVWRDDEPVIVPETTITVGVCATECIGVPVNEKSVHRLELYRARYGRTPDKVTSEMFRRMYEAPDGMFAHARGEKYLWKNGADIAAVVLASGFSQRMGQNKLMMDICGQPMIIHVLEAVGAVVFSGKYAVTNQSVIASLAQNRGFTAVENKEAQSGQSASVVCGTAAAMRRAPEGLMFFMGDMPFIEPGMIRKLKTAFAAAGGKKIIVPKYPEAAGRYRRGNPVIFPAKYAKELLKLEGDIGGRAVIKAHEDNVYEVLLSNGQWGRDIDSQEDFKDSFNNTDEVCMEEKDENPRYSSCCPRRR